MPTHSKLIDTAAFSLAVFSIVILNKLASFLAPYHLYFTFSSFLFDQSSHHRLQSLAIKLLLPTLYGFAYYFVSVRLLIRAKHRDRITPDRAIFLSEISEPSVKYGALFAAILLAWPVFEYWDILVDPPLSERQLPFYAAYVLYFIAYYYFAGFGVKLAQLQLQKSAGKDKSFFTALPNPSWLAPLRDGAAAVGTSVVATLLTTIVTGSSSS